MLRRAALGDEALQHLDSLVGIDAALHQHRERFAGELVNDIQQPVASACAANFSTQPELDAPVLLDGASYVSEGPFNVTGQLTVELAPQLIPVPEPVSAIEAPPGEYRLCAYLEGFSSEVLATASSTFTMRAPNDSLSLAPSFTEVGKFVVPIGYQIEPGTAPVYVQASLYPEFPIEGQSYNCRFPLAFKRFEPPSGSGTLSYEITTTIPGTWGLCVSVLNKPLSTVELAHAVATITIQSHPAPGHGSARCVVPKLSGKTLVRARSALGRAHCRLGRVTERSGRGHRNGTVLSQSVRPGRKVAAGMKINLIVAR